MRHHGPKVSHSPNYLLDRMIRASGWAILNLLFWRPRILIKKICLFLCLGKGVGWLWWWLVGCEASRGGWGECPPHHPASGGSSRAGGRFSITLLQESGSWVWDCGITGRQPGVCRGSFLSVMGRPQPSTPRTPSPHTHKHQQHNSLQTPPRALWLCFCVAILRLLTPEDSLSRQLQHVIDATKWMCEEVIGLATVLSVNTEMIYWITDQPPE